MKIAQKERDIMLPYEKHFIKGRFSYIVRSLNENGYSHLSDKLSPLIDSYNKCAGVSNSETHTIPSIENIYETSTSFNDFEEKIKKLIETYENILNILNKFNESYKNKVLKEVDTNKIKENEAVNKTIKMVTEADRESNRELKKILK